MENIHIFFACDDRFVKFTYVTLKSIMGEDNNVVVEAKIFGIDLFESSKTDFKIITLKLTDNTDSIYCKVFAREKDEFTRLTKAFKEDMWIKVRGYTKNDQYAKEIVLIVHTFPLLKDPSDATITSKLKLLVHVNAP